ncbi:MAG: hypothetical protein ACOY30_03585 [Bacillota bacterium]
MLNRFYTIPIIIGLCLGLIMAGVQISASALGAAIGDYQVTSLVAVKNDQGSGIWVLGKKIPPGWVLAVKPEDFAALLRGKAAGFCFRTHGFTVGLWENFCRAVGEALSK